MAYVLKQFNQEPIAKGENFPYMNFLIGGTAKRIKSAVDVEVSSEGSQIAFYDEALILNSPLNTKGKYYLHTKIKREIDSILVFDIYLSVENTTGGEIETEKRRQFLKTIQIASGDGNEWVDFEIVFSPLIEANAILFKLRRGVSDYGVGVRYPRVCYLEFSSLSNMIGMQGCLPSYDLIKIGIQTRPGFIMCINGEEIRVGRSGIYELRNGVISIDFFSVVSAGVDVIDAAHPLDGGYESLDEFLAALAAAPRIDDSTAGGAEIMDATNSYSITNRVDSKVRTLSPFSLDYMYKIKEAND